MRVRAAHFVRADRADIYCYLCDDARLDPHLATHLSTFGIHVADQRKTEKSMTELVRARH